MRKRAVRRLTVVVTMACAMLAFASPAWAQSFTKGTEVRVDTFAPDVDVADVNEDGKLDALVGAHNNGPGYVRILAGRGDGTFDAGTSHQTVTYAGGLAAGDIDKDGHQDLVYAANSGSRGSLSVDRGDGTGSFAHSTSVGVGSNPGPIVLADIDGDNDEDVVVGSAWPGSSFGGGGGTVAVIPNNGGTLGTPVLYRLSDNPGNSPAGISFGDVDGDTDLDMAVARYGQDVALLTNTGVNSGSFSIGSAATGNNDTGSVVLDDFDGDGYADLASGNANSSGGLGVALSDGSGGFGTPTRVENLAGLRALRAADFDGDGDKDLAAARTSSYPNTVFAYANNGSGAFSRASSITPNTNAGLYEDLAVGNLNGDRYPDMIALRSNPDAGIIPLLADPPPNAAPAVSSVELSPSQPKPDDTLTATVRASDPNGDAVTLSYKWQIKNQQTGDFVDIQGETGASLDLSKPGLGDPGDTIRVVVTATDPGNLSSSKTSNEVTVADTRPGISVSPANLVLDPRPVGSIGPAGTLTVTNTGPDQPLNVSAVRKAGANPGDFVISNDGCSGETVPSGGSCEIGVRFAPEAAGARSASVDIASDAIRGTSSAALSGTGKLVAQNDSYATDEDETLTVPAPGVLANDTDGVPLTALEAEDPNNGSITLNAGGSFEYVPDANFDGTDSFTYRAADGDGESANKSNEARVVISVRPVEDPAPETNLDSTPDSITNNTSAVFEFSSAKSGAAFECSLDDAPFTTCDSPEQYTGLSEGQHLFEVRAVDAAGGPDPTPARHRWTVDATAPNTALTEGPSGTVGSAAALFDFMSSENGATFECSLDGADFTSCEAPKEYAGLDDGSHVFRVRGMDAAGNADPTPTVRSWAVDTRGPVVEITAGPSGSSNAASATFEFSSEAGASFECSLDGGAWGVCSSPRQYAGLSQGPHTFEARATDRTGNTGVAVSRAWEVDTTAPTVESVSPRNGAKRISKSANVVVAFSEAMDEASVTRADVLTLKKRGTVKLVPAARSYDPATNSLTLDPSRTLKPGATYVARVRFPATDEAGNDLQEITAWSFTIKR